MSLMESDPARGREWQRIVGVFALAALTLFIALGALHAVLAPYARDAQSAASLMPPSGAHFFGTDVLGRDVFSETLHALGTTLGDAAISFAIALVLGNFAGLLLAHMLGRAAALFRLAAAVLSSIPALLLAILIAALFGHAQAAIAVGLAIAPHGFARSYDRTRQQLSSPYADFARASGVSDFSLFKRDLLFELREHITATAARALAAVTIALATMSFFGFGAVPPARDLGLMIASARAMFAMAPWTALAPAIMLLLLILAARLAAGLSGGERA